MKKMRTEMWGLSSGVTPDFNGISMLTLESVMLQLSDGRCCFISLQCPIVLIVQEVAK
jgi:hypothetical protein